MKTIKEILICDRCKKEVDNLNDVYDSMYHYELCEECEKDFNAYKEKTKLLEEQYTQLQKENKFGKFMFEENNER